MKDTTGSKSFRLSRLTGEWLSGIRAGAASRVTRLNSSTSANIRFGLSRRVNVYKAQRLWHG